MVAKPLPQQQLLLELITMSGEIAISLSHNKNSLLWRTMQECELAGWVKLEKINNEYVKVVMTIKGRMNCKYISPS